MKVRAKWNLKDGSGWHKAGEVFEAEDPEVYGGGVELLERNEAPKTQEAPETPAEPAAEPEAKAAKPRTRKRTKE